MSSLLLFLAAMPVPRDLALPLPLPESVLKVLLVLFFLLHIFFVNLMVGGSFMVVFFECLGLRSPKWDALAHEIAKTVTVNKSLAVVLGIGPLLCINLVYTVQWYGANALTGHAWLLIVPTVTSAFLLAYLHKYTWARWAEGSRKKAHLALGVLVALHFLFIPLIFLANVNLMHFPGEWEKVQGFFSSLQVGNVLPRYLHFLMASVALASLFMVGWFGRRWANLKPLPGLTQADLRRTFYKGAAWPTAAQFVVGPLLLFTLPQVGITPKLYLIIFSGAALGAVVLFLLLKEIAAPDETIGRRFTGICILFSVVVLGMGSGRQVYRQAALADHRAAVKERTAAYEAALAEFNRTHRDSPGDAGGPTGQQLFAACAACHAPAQRLVGPPVLEIVQIYANNPAGIVTWAKAPGKKRPDYPPMPPFAHLPDSDLKKIADYMLEMGANPPPSP
jgi:cytochrome c